MRVELISTGDELLTGDITDTNASWLAQQLCQAGIKLAHKSTVGDDLEALVQVFLERADKADFIIVNGGLGPTSDDLSAAAAAQALAEPVVLFESWVDEMKIKFASTNRPMTDNNLKQAMLPQSATIIDNPVGTACGFKIQLGKATMVFTPGVPREFKPMVTNQVLPMLAAANDTKPLIINRYLCMGIGESTLANLLAPISLPIGAEFGYRAELPFIELKIFHDSDLNIDEQLTQLEHLLADYCVVKGGNSLSFKVHELLCEKSVAKTSFKFATVESCTGGMVAESLITYAGSSSYLDRGLITYSNEAKRSLVNVSQQTLAAAGAVSTEVAEEMARGAIDKYQLDLAVSITGIAGPDGGSVQKPVGTVAFALVDKQQCFSQMLCLPDRGRTSIRVMACSIALDMVRRYAEGKPVLVDYSIYPKLIA